MAQGEGHGDGKKRPNSGYLFKAEMDARFADQLDVGMREKREFTTDSRVWPEKERLREGVVFGWRWG